MRSLFAALALCLVASVASADVVMIEDFEDTTVNYTVSTPDDLSDIANRDYYGIILPGDGLPADVAYSNLQGNGFYGVQDTDGATTPVDTITMDFSVNITNYENLSFSIFVAEDDANDTNQDWDTFSSLLVEFQIDGGGFQNLFAVESELGTDGNETNEAPREDTDFDQVGDGTEITNVFQEFTKSIAGTGSTLDLRITITDLDSGDEDVAIDNVSIEGDFTGIPEPGTMIILGAIAPLMLLRRRKR